MVRIFIADDLEFVRATLRQVIGQADKNWEVCGEAANGREAVEKAVDAAPDLIILDVAMPLLDGIGAAKAIRARLPDVPILIYTFMSFEHLEFMAKQAGAQGVVQKGNLRALIGEIRRVLAAAPATQEQAGSDGDSARLLSNSKPSASGAAASAEAGALQEEIASASSGEPAAGGEEPST